MTCFITPIIPLCNRAQRPCITSHPRQRPKAARPRSRPHASLFHPLPPRPPEYQANVGKVIDVLRHDIPLILLHPLNMSIYHPQIMFTDSNGATIHGFDAYRSLLWLLRTQARIFFTGSCVEIKSVFHDDYEGKIYIRWSLMGELRMGRRVVIDGLSLYRLGVDGRVVEHCLESISRSRGGKVRLVAFGNVGRGEVAVDGCGVGGGGWYSGCEEFRSEELELEDKLCV